MYSVKSEITNPAQKEFGNLGCVRYPPIPFPMEDGVHSHILPTNHNWWCGEWRPKPAPKLELPPDGTKAPEE